MNAKHTPGPWSFDRYGKIIGSNGEGVVLGGVSISCGRVSPDNPCHANDKLVCAAPDLLEALEKVRQDINWMLNSRKLLNPEVFDYIDSAIAKARGEA